MVNSCTPFEPHDQGVVTEEALEQFVEGCGDVFLALPCLTPKFKSVDMATQAQNVVKTMNVYNLANEIGGQGSSNEVTFWKCPLVWDTGASFGLTPFHQDFMNYVELSITVNDISKSNTVIGLGTTLHKYMVNGKPIWLPCLSCHLPSANIHLFSPQT